MNSRRLARLLPESGDYEVPHCSNKDVVPSQQTRMAKERSGSQLRRFGTAAIPRTEWVAGWLNPCRISWIVYLHAVVVLRRRGLSLELNDARQTTGAKLSPSG